MSPLCPVYHSNNSRYALKNIERELRTEIRPIPKEIDKRLYVAEFQDEANMDEATKAALYQGKLLQEAPSNGTE